MVGKPRRQIPEATGHTASAVSKQQWTGAVNQLPFPMYTVMHLSQAMVPPTVTGPSPPSLVNAIKTIPPEAHLPVDSRSKSSWQLTPVHDSTLLST